MIAYSQIPIGYQWCNGCRAYHQTLTAPCVLQVIYDDGRIKAYRYNLTALSRPADIGGKYGLEQ